MQPNNGHNENGLTEFVCEDTGIILQIRKVPWTLTREIMRQYEKANPEPLPPMQEVDYGDGEKIKEPNIAHPVYKRLMAEYLVKHNEAVEQSIRELFTEIAIECEVDKSVVRRLREQTRKLGIDLHPDDKYVYVWDIAVGTQSGYRDLMTAIQTRSQPTKEAIEKEKASFPSQVSPA